MKQKQYKSFFSLLADYKIGFVCFFGLPLLDTVLYLKQQSFLAKLLNLLGEMELTSSVMTSFFLYFVIATVIYEVFQIFKNFYVSSFIAKLKKHLDTVWVSKVLNYDDTFFNKNGETMVLTAINNVALGMESGCYELKAIFTSVYYVSGIIYTFYRFGAGFLVITLAWIVIWLLVSNFLLKLNYDYSIQYAACQRAFSFNIGDIFKNISVIKSYNTEEKEKERNVDFANEIYKIYKKSNIVDAGLDFVGTVLYLIFFSIYAYYTYQLLLAKAIKFGDIALIVMYIRDIYSNLSGFNDHLSSFIEMMGQTNDGLGILNQGSRVQLRFKPHSLVVNEGNVILRDLKYRYSHTCQYQLNVDGEINIPAGSSVAIVGPSGSGKTTLFKLILGLLPPQSGEIIIDDQDLSACNMKSIREQLVLVSQDVGIFHRSIAENISYGVDFVTQEEIDNVLEATNLSELVQRLEKGQDSVIGTDTDFSGGQQQRIALARGLIKKAKIFLFDESTSALDAHNEAKVLENLHKITKGSTKFIIAHKIKTVKTADIILVMDGGKIIEKGTHNELIAQKGAYSSLVSLL